MNRTYLIVGTIVLLLIVGFMMFRGGSPAVDTGIELADTTESGPARLDIIMNAQSGSGQPGTTTFTDVGGKAGVIITVSSGGANVPQPAHIHMGTCDKPGAVTYTLSPVVNGNSETLLDTTFKEIMALGQIIVNVHKSAAEAGVYVSCGDIGR